MAGLSYRFLGQSSSSSIGIKAEVAEVILSALFENGVIQHSFALPLTHHLALRDVGSTSPLPASSMSDTLHIIVNPAAGAKLAPTCTPV